MADEKTDVADQGTNKGDPGYDNKGDDQSVDNKTDATDQKVDDQQAADDKTEECEKKPDETQLTKDVKVDDEGVEKPKSEAPEKYEDFTLPKGFTMAEGALEAFNPVAKDLGLSQENAQKLINLYSTVQAKNIENINNAFAKEHEEMVAKVKADPEMGGDKYESNIKLASNVIGKFGNKGVVEVLTATGLGDNPEVIRMFLKIGKAMGEDTFVNKDDGGGGGPTNPKKKSLGDVLYPDM